MLRVNEKMPVVDLQSCEMVNGAVIKGSKTTANKDSDYTLYCFYPKNYTTVCPTELQEFDKRYKELNDRGCESVNFLSLDDIDNHFRYYLFLNLSKITLLNCPIELAFKMGVMDLTEELTLRATFIVNSENKILWCSMYPFEVGRSVDEVLRVLDALNTQEMCGCDWKGGDKTLNEID